MNRRRTPIFCQIFIVLSIICTSFAKDIINCSGSSLSNLNDKNIVEKIASPEIYFKYNRDDLKVYSYPNTPSVNLFIDNAEIVTIDKFEGTKKMNGIDILGVANVKQNYINGSYNFEDCAFFLEDQEKRFKNELPSNYDSTIFEVVENCLTTQLCSYLSPITENDRSRARNTPRDFGPMSIDSRSITISFPKIVPPQRRSNPRPSFKQPSLNNSRKNSINYVEAAETILRMTMFKFQTESGGKILLPDINHLISQATKGSLEGVNHLIRDQTVLVRGSPPTENPKTFSFTFSIPEGHVKYDKYKAVRFQLFSGKMCADVQDISFSATVEMNFTPNQCHASLKKLTTKNVGKSNSYACGRLSFVTNIILKWFVKAWDNTIVEDVRKQIETAIASILSTKFDCENYR